jgi:Flp pilus assembly protein TadD
MKHYVKGLTPIKLGLPALAALLLAACASSGTRPAAPAPSSSSSEAAAGAAQPVQGDPEQRFQSALQLMKDKKPQDAKDAFTKLAQDFPQYSGPLNDLGVLQAQGKQSSQAIASFEHAASVSAQNDFAWGWLGILYRENGDYARAEQAYLKAIALKPENAVTHLNLGILYDVYLKRPQDALAQYKDYQRITGKDGRPVVAAWINELQDSLQPPPSAATPAAGQATSTAGAVSPVEHTP